MEALHPPVAAPGEQAVLAQDDEPGEVLSAEDLSLLNDPLSAAGTTGTAYRTATWLASPLIALHLLRRYGKGRETPDSLRERWVLGPPPAERKNNEAPLIWFHAVSIGESAVALPLVHRCLQEHPDVSILFTTSTVEAHQLLHDAIPKERVSLRFAPLDVPWVVDRFLSHWKPAAGVFVESELWPNLICRARARGVRLALLNARISTSSFMRWHSLTRGRDLVGAALACFSLIVPQSDLDVGRFRLLGAQLWQMPGWCADLKYAAAMGACVWQMWRPKQDRVNALAASLRGRQCWVAASTHDGEEMIIGSVHQSLEKLIPDLLTIVVPRHPWRCGSVKEDLEAAGLHVVLWTSEVVRDDPEVLLSADILLVDAVGELPLLFSVAEVAFVGGSMFDGSRGHNLAEAAVAGCAVLVGPHAGHFSRMAEELNEAARESSLLFASLPPADRHLQFSLEACAPGPGPASAPPSSSGYATPTGGANSSLGGASPRSDLRRAIHRRRAADRDSEDREQQNQNQSPAVDLTAGLEELADDVAERWEHVNWARRRTHLGGTPSNEWMQGRPVSSPALQPSQMRYLGSHRNTPEQPARDAAPDSPSSTAPSTPRFAAGSLSSPQRVLWQSSTWPPPRDADVANASAPARDPEELDDLLRDAAASLRDENGVSFSHTLRQRPEDHAQQLAQQQARLPAMSSPVLARYPSKDIMPAHYLPSHPMGPCIWTVEDEADLTAAVGQLMEDSRERRSRGRAAAQASAILAENLVTTVWDILNLKVISPAINQKNCDQQ